MIKPIELDGNAVRALVADWIEAKQGTCEATNALNVISHRSPMTIDAFKAQEEQRARALDDAKLREKMAEGRLLSLGAPELRSTVEIPTLSLTGTMDALGKGAIYIVAANSSSFDKAITALGIRPSQAWWIRGEKDLIGRHEVDLIVVNPVMLPASVTRVIQDGLWLGRFNVKIVMVS